MNALVILGGLLLLLFTGLPIAFALGGMGLLLLVTNGLSPIMVPQNLYGGLDSFVLLAVPLFLMMSNVLLKGGVGRDLYAGVQSWVGHWPGGLAAATIISCAMFSAISGSSVATAGTIATIAVPEMIERGYRRSFVFGLLAAGGTLGILIPPSIPLIIYGVVTDQSIAQLFLAGVVPGLLLAGAFIAYAVIYSHLSGAYTPLPKATGAERVRATVRALPTLALALVITVGIYAGAFTPTEAAGIGFALSLLLTAVILRSLTWARFKEAMMGALHTTVTIFLIMIGAKIFSKAIVLERVPQAIGDFIIAHFPQAGPFLLVVCGVLLVMGLFLESLSMLLIVVPILFPSLAGFGIDPIWFGIMFVIMIECALISPPVGMNLFVIQAVSGAGLGEITRGVWPLILIMLGMVLVLYLVPGLVLWLPLRLG